MKHLDEIELQQAFVKKIKILRKHNQYSQSDLSGKSDLEKTAIQRIERGHNSTLKTLQKLANAFDITLSELCDIYE